MMHDIIVCGAGPAGSVVAQRLAAAGARVVLVGMASRAGWEGLSARALSLLADEGLDQDTDLVAGPYSRRGIWADGRSIEGTEWLVERSALAEAACARARSAGADYRLDGMTSAKRAVDHWRVSLRSGHALEAPILVDARGRRGAQRRGPLLLAYGQRFRKWMQGSSGTGIAATDDGWCWWAERGPELWVQVIGRPRSGHPSAWIAAAAAQVPALARALDGASIDGDPVARPAHARLGMRSQDPTLWRVGDAAFAQDPLSGQGVYEAVRGARLTATAIQSVIDGGDAVPAHRFITERHEETWRGGVRVAAGFYRENGGRGAFWIETAAAYEALLRGAVERATGADVAADAEAARHVEAAQGAEVADGAEVVQDVAIAKSVVAICIERRPVLDQGRILERDVFVTAENPRGVWHVGGVPLVALKRYLETAERATIAGAAVAFDRPRAAVASAIHWLQKTCAVPGQVPPRSP